jgi:hypothetical protein
MEKLIKNVWLRKSGEPFAVAKILDHKIHPEGLDVSRLRFIEAGRFVPESGVGRIISVLRGNGRLLQASDEESALALTAGIHIYLPHGLEYFIEAIPGTELLLVAGASPSQARGKQLILRDEDFLAACASGTQSLRWVLTPQYLSRRIFLHNDPVLLSKSGNPVSWFRTTMFDVRGLPKNEEGEPVFKMSYNSKTEFNVCYDVEGTARVRMALHPYRQKDQRWGSWLPLDGDSTYHLNEAAGGPEEECLIDASTGSKQFLRNRHEVYIMDGHVTLFCLFDPAPTGIERHRPGEYSDYQPLAQVLGTKLYENHMKEIVKYDAMVDRLSLAKARGELGTLGNTPLWELYVRGRKAQVAIEATLARNLAAEGSGRERVIAQWMQPASP